MREATEVFVTMTSRHSRQSRWKVVQRDDKNADGADEGDVEEHTLGLKGRGVLVSLLEQGG